MIKAVTKCLVNASLAALIVFTSPAHDILICRDESVIYWPIVQQFVCFIILSTASNRYLEEADLFDFREGGAEFVLAIPLVNGNGISI